MKRLFKEVFRSLSKNKVTLVCLTILIFLTTFLFTLLNDVRTSYSRTLNSYDKVSKLHDLTADLDLNPSGIIPNSGYDQIKEDNVTKTKDPIKFKLNTSNISYSINLPTKKQNFIQIKDISGWDDANGYKEKYISTEEFLKLYYDEINHKITSTQFEINKTNPDEGKIGNFQFGGDSNNNKKFKIYDKPDFNSLVKEKIQLKESDQITFNHDYTLGDILTISSSPRGPLNAQPTNDAVIDASPLFINLKEKKASFELSDYDQWKDDGILYIVQSDEVLKLLGFEKDSSKNEWHYKSNSNNNNTIKLQNAKTNSTSIDSTDKLEKTFKLSNNNASVDAPKYVELKANKTYSIPKNWIRKTEKTIEYNWYRYVLNWNEKLSEQESNWKGSYYKYITNFYNTNKTEYQKQLYFSYWDKTITTKFSLLSEPSKIQQIVKNEKIDRDDLDKTFATGWKSNVRKENKNIPSNKSRTKSAQEAHNIKQIEFNKFGNESISDDEFYSISDLGSLKRHQDFIRNGTQNFAKTSILRSIDSLVGKENLGIRKSITVETVNEDTSKKNVFHFVDAGDKERKISGFENNVGKLYNETLNPGLLNKSISESDTVEKFLLKPDPNSPLIKKIPSVYTRPLIKHIFKNYTPDINYFNADIRFVNYYNFFVNTQIPKLQNGKILVITTADDEQKSAGASVIGAIAMPLPNKYILLHQATIDGFSNERVWKKIIVDNKDYLDLDELYTYLIKNNYTVRGEIGKNGWVVISNQFRNAISLPLSFGSISNDLVQEIVQKNTIKKLIEEIQDVLQNSEFIKLFDKNDVSRILKAVSDSVESNGFHTLLSVGKTNQFILQKVILDVIKYLINPINDNNSRNLQYSTTNANSFIQNVFVRITNFFKQKYIENSKNEAYFATEINKLSKVLGFSDVYIIPQLKLSLADLLGYIKDKEKIFDILNNLIKSIDFIKFSSLINEWYDKHPYKPFTSTVDKYWTLSNHRVVISLLKSVNENKFKNAIKDLINLVDFGKFLKPDENEKNSFFAKWLNAHKEAKTYNEDITKPVKKFFENLDGSKDQKYSNINQGLSSLISNISISKFTNTLEKVIRHTKYPIVANEKIYNDYNTEELNKFDYLVAFMTSLSLDINNNVSYGKINQIQNAIIKILNLSNKTQKLGGELLNIAIPSAEDGKISILDLSIIPKLAFPAQITKNKVRSTAVSINALNLNDIQRVIGKIDSAIKSKSLLKLSQNELNFIRNEALVQEVELNNLELIKTKLTNYYEFIKKIHPKNLKPVDGNYDFKIDGDNKKIETYGDLAYWSAMIDEKSENKDLPILKKLHNLIVQYAINPIFLGDKEYSIIKNEFVTYSLWIKLAYLLNYIERDADKITIDEKTERKIIEKQYKKIFSFDQIKVILNELYNFAKNKEVIEQLTNFDKVINPISSNIIFGSDSSYNATTFKIPYAHAHTNLANKELEKLLDNSDAINTFKKNLKEKAKITNDTLIKKIIDLLKANSYELTYNLGYIASANQSATNYDAALNKFINSFLKTSNKNSELQPLINNNYELDLAFKMTINNTNLRNHLALLNVPNNLLNPLTLLSFPQIPLYYALSPNPNEGNIAYIVKKILNNLRFSNATDISKQIEALKQQYTNSISFVESKSDEAVDLDVSKFNNLFNNVLKDNNDKDLTLFDINITGTLRKMFEKLITPISVSNIISYTDSGSYLAKINYGYASKNKKEVYKGDISKYLSDPFGMQAFIESLDEKYKIKINSQEYLIIGIDATADYLYPVVNEENIQVDTESQAIVYVNSKGFDRIYSSYPTFAIKEYALVKAPVDSKNRYLKGKSPTELKEIFNKDINLINPNSPNKVYLKDELDSINPERKIRVTTIRSIIKTIRSSSAYLISILIILIAFIVYFIMKRYIEARNKVVGILRAQGYKTSKIALAFCAFGWIPVFVGSFFGYILGYALQKPAMSILSSYWTLENVIIPINAITLILTILVPFIFVSILIFIITSISVRKKPTELMSGIVEVSVGNFAQRISAMFRRLPVKVRFIASMALNNFWKMFSLFLAFSTTSLISMFFLSSNNIFNKAITKTYKDRLYKFKLDLETPTTEGGPYVTYNKSDINSLLYVPNDLAGSTSSNGSQLDYANPNFLRPGDSFNTDVIQKKFEPVVLTKSSLDILLDLAVELSPWDITYANMPETQRARVAQIFVRVSRQIRDTQNLVDIKKAKAKKGDYLSITTTNKDDIIAVRDLQKFKKDLEAGKEEDLSNRTSFFWFTNNVANVNESFKFIEWNKDEQVYQKPKAVSTAKYRQEYRNFLVNAYRKIPSLDFFVSFGGVYWNDATNEKYTYAKALLGNKEIKVYGYYDNSRFISIRNKANENLQKKLRNYSGSNIPIIVNTVSEKKYKLKVGSIINLDILNHVDRFSYKALNQKAPQTKYKFEVIDVSDTYINEEFVTTKDALDRILGFDSLSKRLKDARKLELENAIFLNPNKEKQIKEEFERKYDAFNGILSNDSTPVQTIDTLTTYSSTGFWGAAATFDAENSNDQEIWEFFKRIFISDKGLNYKSVYEHNVEAYNEAHIEAKLNYKDSLFKLLKINEDQFNRIVKYQNTNEEFKSLARNVLTKFYGSSPQAIYGKNIMFGASFNVNSKDIEAGFITGISKTVNIILIAFIIMSLLISIIILIVITNIMIASNQRAIATFSVLGYTNAEKVMLFFANFIPAILFACLLMIPVTLALISAFNAFMMATSQIVLPLVLNHSTIIISAALCLTVFALTSMATWRSLNKIKPIDALKGK
ncbi:ABC transporter permease [Metamycoplasma auris]|uniref:ABC-type antimicrobial peptide transport system permease subunit n=1 Tax=Metamycoplasma auris TaxID=51363 RepID=A0A2W7G161_9BACT|nr:ABC transporter permease [Metamycoplasma auris]PZV99966.1 ABC-type antimicrobial peptide transport system permease subunit [Metamycoplasma auris]